MLKLNTLPNYSTEKNSSGSQKIKRAPLTDTTGGEDDLKSIACYTSIPRRLQNTNKGRRKMKSYSHMRNLLAFLFLASLMGAITIDQPENGEVLGAGPQQPSGEVDLAGLQQGDHVMLTWDNTAPNFFHSGIQTCDEGWGGEFGENDWFCSDSFELCVPGTWSMTAKHLRGGNLIAQVNHGGDMEAFE
jgi:hypothetical protein